ncbi:DUF3253 domain-containing protein [Pleomorphomonas sp. PLEO]|uniref:DUF3253 domain-containing protein n=1 Tax=Pleomorphomonas sp. PLEO TaxID=3239306 RepID=UPI00351F1289
MTDVDPRRVKAGQIRDVLLQMAAESPAGKSISPDAVARAIAGKDEKVWRRLMKPIKDEAARLAKDGKVIMIRKGKPVDPDRVRGLYRIRLRAEGEPMPVYEAPKPEDDLLDDDFILDDDED